MKGRADAAAHYANRFTACNPDFYRNRLVNQGVGEGGNLWLRGTFAFGGQCFKGGGKYGCRANGGTAGAEKTSPGNFHAFSWSWGESHEF
jgi:hypothetical protein